MSQALAPTTSPPGEQLAPRAEASIYESLALRGDISGLKPDEKVRYYGQLCQRLGLDPYTQPFLPLTLNGKQVLYASRSATDQLARIHNLNREVISREHVQDVYVVTVKATLPNGREEYSIGAVPLGTLKGEQLANALMKAETKAKRRATLAILGLGMLDESELETIPRGAMRTDGDAAPLAKSEIARLDDERRQGLAEKYVADRVVSRVGDKYVVEYLLGHPLGEVTRDQNLTPQIRCTCADFDKFAVKASDAEFKCEHIRAVKLFVIAAQQSATEAAVEVEAQPAGDGAVEAMERNAVAAEAEGTLDDEEVAF